MPTLDKGYHIDSGKRAIVALRKKVNITVVPDDLGNPFFVCRFYIQHCRQTCQRVGMSDIAVIEGFQCRTRIDSLMDRGGMQVRRCPRSGAADDSLLGGAVRNMVSNPQRDLYLCNGWMPDFGGEERGPKHDAFFSDAMKVCPRYKKRGMAYAKGKHKPTNPIQHQTHEVSGRNCS